MCLISVPSGYFSCCTAISMPFGVYFVTHTHTHTHTTCARSVLLALLLFCSVFRILAVCCCASYCAAAGDGMLNTVPQVLFTVQPSRLKQHTHKLCIWATPTATCYWSADVLVTLFYLLDIVFLSRRCYTSKSFYATQKSFYGAPVTVENPLQEK